MTAGLIENCHLHCDGTHLLGQVASALGRVQDLVVEHREVQGQTQTDGVGRGQVDQSNVLWDKHNCKTCVTTIATVLCRAAKAMGASSPSRFFPQRAYN